MIKPAQLVEQKELNRLTIDRDSRILLLSVSNTIRLGIRPTLIFMLDRLKDPSVRRRFQHFCANEWRKIEPTRIDDCRVVKLFPAEKQVLAAHAWDVGFERGNRSRLTRALVHFTAREMRLT